MSKKKKKEPMQKTTMPYIYDEEAEPVADTFQNEISKSQTQERKYGNIATQINEKYGTDFTYQSMRDEMCKIVNKLFRNMISEHPTKMFQVVEVMAQEFNVEEEKLVRYLDKDNYNRLREFAKKNYCTYYWENMERKKFEAKAKKKGKKTCRIQSSNEMFED